MIAANVNVKALSEFIGHSSITTTLDRYGHLFPGSLAEATSLLDAYLVRTGANRGAKPQESLQSGIPGGLENRCPGQPGRGFESHPRRWSLDRRDLKCQ
jgi:hypothetical protein